MNNKPSFDPQHHPFAEVFEAELEKFSAQCWQWNQMPMFGDIVVTSNDKFQILGCITNIRTGSTDPLRVPFAYQATEEELRKTQPQIFKFLKTTFEVHTIGYRQTSDTNIKFRLPPQPALIHNFVMAASNATLQQLRENPLCFQMILNEPKVASGQHDLILAVFLQLARIKPISSDFLESFQCLHSTHAGGNIRQSRQLFRMLESCVEIKLEEMRCEEKGSY